MGFGLFCLVQALPGINVIIENDTGFVLETVALIEVVALAFSQDGGYKYSHNTNSI